MPLPAHIKERIKKHVDQRFSLSLSNANIWDDDIGELVELVNANPKITYLNLECNNIENIGAKELVLLTNVTNLDVSQNNLDDDAAITLINASQFIKLDLSRNWGITDRTGQFILDQKTQHTFLSIQQTKVSEELRNKISEKVRKRNNSTGTSSKQTESNELSIPPVEKNAANQKTPSSPMGLFSKTTETVSGSSLNSGSSSFFACFGKNKS